jgi:hypothetical protein
VKKMCENGEINCGDYLCQRGCHFQRKTMTKTVFWFPVADYAALSTAEAYPEGFVLYCAPGCDASYCVFMIP